MVMNSAALFYNSTGGVYLNFIAGQSSTVANYSFRNNQACGIGNPVTNAVSLIAGSIEGLRVDGATTALSVRTWLNPDGATGLGTGLWFGDGNTGFYESLDNALTFTSGGTDVFFFFNNTFGATNTTGGAILNETTSAINPTVLPDRSQVTTGVGSSGTNQLSLITGGIEGVRVEADKSTFTGSVIFNTAATPGTSVGGEVRWNSNEKTIDIDTGLGPVVQSGHEMVLLIYNNTGVQIDNFSVLRPVAATLVGGYIVPTVELADASIHSGAEGTLMVATMDIPDGQVGIATRFGRARAGNTSAFNPGDDLYLSATTPGTLTNIRPEFPNYNLSIGGALNSDVSNGEIFVSITRDVFNTVLDGWDGAIRETFDFRVSSDGVTITGSLENSDLINDLTIMFSDGFYTFDVTPAATVTLTAGTDTNPQSNYVYIDKATKTLQVSTSDWPVAEHARIAYVYLRSATATQTDDALINQNWNDHIKSTGDNGHILHLAERLRQESAKWHSGAQGTCTVGGAGTTVDIATTAGVVYQLHRQNIPALDTSLGHEVHIVNDSVAPFKGLTDIETQTTDATGTSLLNSSFSYVLWGVQNKTGETSHLMLNLPSGSYSRLAPDNAVNDADNYSVYTIPAEFKSVGFLIARFTFQLTAGGVWTLYDTQDLRGFEPSNAAGGSSGGGASEFTALTDTPSSYVGQALQALRVNAGETALEFVTASNSYNIQSNSTSSFVSFENTGIDEFVTAKVLSTTITDPLMVFQNGSSAEGMRISTDGNIWMANNTLKGVFHAATGSTWFLAGAGGNTSKTDFSTATSNFGAGEGALAALTTGDNNVALGFNSLDAVLGGSSNVGIGRDSGQSVTSGGFNFFGGGSTGVTLTTGSFNVLVGHLSDVTNSAEAGAVAVGYQSKSDTEGVSIGYQAGNGTTGGGRSFRIGYQSGINSDGNNNVFVGSSSGATLGGLGNIAIGVAAGLSAALSSGSYNVLIGQQTGVAIEDGSYNVALGYRSGYSGLIDSSRNIFLGAESGYYETGASSLYVSSLTSAEQVDLATSKVKSLIYGTQNTTTVNQTLALNAQVSIPYQLSVGTNLGYTNAEGLAFGDGSSRIYQNSDGSLTFYTGDSISLYLTGTLLQGENSNYVLINHSQGLSSTVPIYSFRGDTGTGINRAAASQLSLISNSIEGLRLEEASSHVIQKVELHAGITASATQSQGQQVLLSSYNQVSTVATTNDVVTMPTADAGRKVTIINSGANTLQIYPSSGDNLGAGVDTSVTLAAGSSATYVAYDSTNWAQI
jgi:hypothetical protein